MEENKFWDLLARKLAGEASLRELYELDKVIYAEPRLQFLARLVMELWRNREVIAKEPEGEDRFIQIIQEAYLRKLLHDKSVARK